MDLPLLKDILILLAFAVVIVFLLQRLKLPSIIGFLITGIIIGPYALSLIKNVEQVETLSEIGVILLLFVIGMEMSIKQLASIRKTVFLGGFFQVGVTILISAVLYQFTGHSWSESVFIGFLLALSSTAIVLKTLQDRHEMAEPHAKNALAILIFQDIIVVPMLLFTPLIAGESTNIWASVIGLLLKSIAVIVITVLLARYVIPKVMYEVAKTNSKELFLLVTITLCFAIAFLTSIAGLSLALGAFIAGLIISESEYSYQATSVILPFRELFTSFFFVSVGMLLDISFFFEHFWTILPLGVMVFFIKSIIAAGAVAILKYPPKTIILTGLTLFQVGEFAFILSKVGITFGLLTPETNQYFLSVSILTMLCTPFVIILSKPIANKLLGSFRKIGIMKKNEVDDDLDVIPDMGLKNHLVIIGYGPNGQNLARVAIANNIPFVVVELNADTVKEKKEVGVPIIYGDAGDRHILESVNLYDARAAVVAVSDIHSTKNIIKNIRSISESLYLIARTRYNNNTSDLLAMGADEVVPEEFETSIQIFSRVLHNFLVPENDINDIIKEVRADNYQVLMGELQKPKPDKAIRLAPFNIICLRINSDSNKFLGSPLNKLNLRADYGINILGIKRRDKMMENIKADEVLKQGDLLYIQGNTHDIEEFHQIIK